MPNGRLALVLQRIRTMAEAHRSADSMDRGLIERFVAVRDEVAFTAIVQRHGPLVLGVCRRLLREAQDAEDAFQATFLVLARKAATLDRRGSVAGWLYTVAYRAALKIKARTVRRGSHERHDDMIEQRPDTGPSDSGAGTSSELRCLLDEEVNRLPEKYRLPLVLCYLQGMTNEEAARELSWPVGTVSGRLARARDRLRERLTRRGLTLSAAGLVVALSEQGAVAAVPAPLVLATVRASMLFASGQPAAETLAAVVEGTMHAMIMIKRTLAVAVLLGLSVLGLGAAALVYHSHGGPQPGHPEDDTEIAQAPLPVVKVESDPAAKAARLDAHGDPLPDGAVARLGTLRFHHEKDVTFVAYKPDGKTVISASQHSIRFWEAETGREIRALLFPGRYLTTVALSADGGILAASCHDYQQRCAIQFWETDTGKELPPLRLGNRYLASLRLAPDGKTLALPDTSAAPVRLWDVVNGKDLRRVGKASDTMRKPGPAGGMPATMRADAAIEMSKDGRSSTLVTPPSVDFAPDGRTLYIHGGDGKSRRWDIATGKELGVAPGWENIGAVWAVSVNGQRMVTRAGSNAPTIREFPSARQLRQIERFPNGFRSVALSADGKYLAAIPNGADGTRVWEVVSGKEICRLQETAFATLAFSPDGKTLATGAPYLVRFWDLATGKELHGGGHQAEIVQVGFTHAAKDLVSVDQTGTVLTWQLADGKEKSCVRPATPASVFAASLAPDGRTLALARGGPVVLLDVASGKELRQIPAGPQRLFNAAVFAPDGKSLALADSHGGIGIHDATSGAESSRLQGPPRAAPAAGSPELRAQLEMIEAHDAFLPPHIQFASDGRTLARGPGRGRGDQGLVVWDVASKNLRRRVPDVPTTIMNYAVARDGRSVVVMDEVGKLSLWEVATGKQRHRFPEASAPKIGPVQPVAETGPASLLALAPDGRTLAASGMLHHIVLWDLVTGKEIGQFQGHASTLTSLAFSTDGKLLASASRDTTIVVWDVAAVRQRQSRAPAASAPRDLHQSWRDLAADDAERAYRAMHALRAAPEQAAALLRDQLQPAQADDLRRIHTLLADLASDRFETRRQATDELEALGPSIQTMLRTALAGPSTLEMHQRLDQLLRQALTAAPPAEYLRMVRAVEVLETIGTPTAWQALEALAAGAGEAESTHEAQAALARRSK